MGKPFVKPEVSEAGTLGAAMLAGVATGLYDDLQQAAECLVKIDKVFEPDKKKHKVYVEKLEKYMKIRATIKDLVDKIN